MEVVKRILTFAMDNCVLLRLWQVPMGMDILLPVLTVYMILWNKL